MAYCDWADSEEQNKKYHDEEWGIPVHDDWKQFEYLMLEVMQCGLSWTLMLRKRDIFRACFDDFDFEKVARYGKDDAARILQFPGMIRSPRKIAAVIQDARCFMDIRNEYGTFSDYIWRWSGGKTILYNKHAEGWIPASNGLSDRISRDPKRRGFRYLGPVTVYSHLQACGIINDHDRHCPCYRKIVTTYPTIKKRRFLEKGVHYFGEEQGKR